MVHFSYFNIFIGCIKCQFSLIGSQFYIKVVCRSVFEKLPPYNPTVYNKWHMRSSIKITRPKSKHMSTCALYIYAEIRCIFQACGIIKHVSVSPNSLVEIKLWIYYLNEVKDYMVLYAENISRFSYFIISFGFRWRMSDFIMKKPVLIFAKIAQI